jgi:hypothetical protein
MPYWAQIKRKHKQKSALVYHLSADCPMVRGDPEAYAKHDQPPKDHRACGRSGPCTRGR